MTYLAAMWAWFSGLSWVAKAGATLTALTPGLAFLGPVGTVLSVVWTAITTIVSWFFQGLQICITHPVVLAVILTAYVGGRIQQHQYDDHLIERARVEAQNVVKKIQGAADVEKAKAEAAIAAREAAKQMDPVIAPITPLPATAVTAPPIALDPKPDGVRHANAVRRRSVCQSVFCF